MTVVPIDTDFRYSIFKNSNFTDENILKNYEVATEHKSVVFPMVMLFCNVFGTIEEFMSLEIAKVVQESAAAKLDGILELLLDVIENEDLSSRTDVFDLFPEVSDIQKIANKPRPEIIRTLLRLFFLSILDSLKYLEFEDGMALTRLIVPMTGIFLGFEIAFTTLLSVM